MSAQPDNAKRRPPSKQVEAESTNGDPAATTEAFTPASKELPAGHAGDARLQPGDVAGQYKIEAVIDEGTFGIVYRAHHETLDRKVALKVAKPSTGESDEQLRRFLEEARTLAKIEHPGIVPVYDSGQLQPGLPYVAMRLLQRDSLQTVLARGVMDWKRASELGVALAEALAYAHEQGVVHRDLKPANILLDDGGNPLLADFGLALHYDNQPSHENELAGTVAYMSPEQIRREAHWLDGRTDIWSLGVILYEMVANRHPFRGSQRGKLAEEILSREPWPLRQINPALPVEFESIVTRCLQKEVGQRYPSATDLADSLRQLLQSDPPPLAPTRAPDSARNNRLLAAGVGAVLVLLTLVVALSTRSFFRQASQNVPTQNSQASSNASARNSGGVSQQERLSNDPTPPATEHDSLGISDMQSRLASSIDLFVWDPRNVARRGIGIRENGALPLRTGDQIRLHVTLNQPAYLYLLWIDSEGSCLPVYPWAPGEWGTRPASEPVVTSLGLPEGGDQGWPLEGAAGMETLVVLARTTPLPASVDLAGQLKGLPLQPMLDPRAIAWFQGGKLVTAKQDSTRAPNFVHEQKIDDPLLATQRILHDRLHKDFELVDAVSFAKQID